MPAFLIFLATANFLLTNTDYYGEIASTVEAHLLSSWSGGALLVFSRERTLDNARLLLFLVVGVATTLGCDNRTDAGGPAW